MSETVTPTAHSEKPSKNTASTIARRWVWWKYGVAGSLLLAGFFLLSRANGERGKQRAEILPTLGAAKIGRQDLTQTITISGEFRPNQEVALHAKVAGFLQAINVDVGDHVREGQVIAQLDVPELKNELEKVSAAVRVSEEEVVRAEAAYAEAHLSYERLKAVAQQRPNLVAQQEIDGVQAKDATSGGAVSVAKLRVQECRAEANRVQSLVGYATITAPFEGVITRRYFDPGALIQAGTSAGAPIVEIAEDKNLRFVFPVPESVVPLVKTGAPVRIAVSSTNEQIEAHISRSSGKIDRATRTMSTEADIKNEGRRFTPGMYASVKLVIRESRNAIVAPVQAISTGERPTAWVVGSDGTVEERVVQLGLQTPDKTEIVSGLKPGDIVLAGTRSGVRPGQKVMTKLIESLAGDGAGL